jgi:Ca2+-binding RTX toxin-like protein
MTAAGISDVAADTIFGGAGDDLIRAVADLGLGDHAPDILVGDAGNDVIIGVLGPVRRGKVRLEVHRNGYVCSTLAEIRNQSVASFPDPVRV